MRQKYTPTNDDPGSVGLVIRVNSAICSTLACGILSYTW